MVKNDKRVFVDRRTDEEKKIGLATPIRYWYDLDRKKRHRTNGVAVTLSGEVVVARSTCSRKDQFSRRHGRVIVAGRIRGRMKASRTERTQGVAHCWIIPVPSSRIGPTINAYRVLFPDDEVGAGRTYNVIKVYEAFRSL